MSEPAKRINGMKEVDTHSICYWKDGGVWMMYLPGCGVGDLSNHTVSEHEDGTITVSPSILVDGHDAGKPAQRHGFLECGVWREA